MSQTYCTDGNSLAALKVVDGETIYQAEFSNPPLVVYTDTSAKKVYLVDTWNSNNQKLITVIPGGWLYGEAYRDNYAFCVGGWTDFYAGQGGGTNLIDSIYFDETATLGGCQHERRYQYFAEPTNSRMIAGYDGVSFYGWEVSSNASYFVTCDGCPPGDCKASKSKYPGYTCLDCQELEGRLKRIGNKLDGI